MGNQYESRLVRRFTDFLAIPATPTPAHRFAILEVLDRFMSRKWRSYVVGGTLRDIMLAPAWAFPRDIDIVVDGPTREDMEGVLADLTVRRTRFGGLHLVKPFVDDSGARQSGEILLDVWRLEDTWGIRANGFAPTIENFVRTPFLNIDSVAIELCSRTTYRQIVEHGFFRSLATRTLEINYEPNPFPLLCIVRALIMAAKLRFSLGPALAGFVLGYSRWGSLEDLVSAQISHYGRVRCEADELLSWMREIRSRVSAGAERIEIDASESRQMDLWRNWPPLPTTEPAATNEAVHSAP